MGIKRHSVLALVIAFVAGILGGGAWLWAELAEPKAPVAPIGMLIPPKIAAAPSPAKPPENATKPVIAIRKVPDAPSPAEIVQPASEPAPAPVPTPMPAAPAKPVRIAIVIDDAGIDRQRTRRAIALPGPLTLAFLVYGKDVAIQAQAAVKAGHELLVHVNMEAESRAVDPGPKVLLRNVEPDINLERLTWMLGRFEGYVGVNNHMGSKFTADSENMTLILKEIKRRGLLFLDSRTSPKSVGANIARAMGIRTAARDVFLDNQPDLAAVKRNLARTEAIARRTGAAIAIGHPKDATLDALAEWLPAAKARGIQLVPVSALARRAGAK